MENYKDIKGYEGLYQVSNLGNVKSLKRKYVLKDKVLKNCNDLNGYKIVTLNTPKKQSTKTIHQLVAMAFLNHVPSGSSGLVVDHIDNDKSNNNSSNLQLITQRENTSKDKKGTSVYPGVSWAKYRNRWYSQIVINKKPIHLGYFKCELAAAVAYNNKLKTI